MRTVPLAVYFAYLDKRGYGFGVPAGIEPAVISSFVEAVVGVNPNLRVSKSWTT